MRFFDIAVSALAVVPVMGHAVHKFHRCADPKASAEFKRKSNGLDRPIGLAPVQKVNIYAHVVTTSPGQSRYPPAQIKKQVTVMNKAYQPLGIQFNLKNTDYTTNFAWASASPQTQDEIDMKNALHKGTYADLNLYFLDNLDNMQGLLGYCPFPYTDIDPKNSTSTQFIKYDGCIILADSLPGGSATPYNLGITAVHEVGHWFGAFHPFQGNSCSGDGDYVDDTPAQSTATFGCPSKKNTCPSAGSDNIHNYMDYSDDSCLNQWTSGQSDRINAVYYYFRSCNGACPTN